MNNANKWKTNNDNRIIQIKHSVSVAYFGCWDSIYLKHNIHEDLRELNKIRAFSPDSNMLFMRQIDESLWVRKMAAVGLHDNYLTSLIIRSIWWKKIHSWLQSLTNWQWIQYLHGISFITVNGNPCKWSKQHASVMQYFYMECLSTSYKYLGHTFGTS